MARVGRFRFLPADRAFSVALGFGAALVLSLACAPGAGQLRQVSTATRAADSKDGTWACVEFEPEARYRNNGYDHTVHLRSRCDRRTLCTVATNVNPTPVEVLVPPHERVDVLTFRGSPAREFTPQVSCRFAP